MVLDDGGSAHRASLIPTHVHSFLRHYGLYTSQHCSTLDHHDELGLYTRSSVKPGTTMLQSAPAAAVNDSLHQCDACASSSAVGVCSRCEQVALCQREQCAHLHTEEECATLQSLYASEGKSATPSMRLLLRVLLVFSAGTNKGDAERDLSWLEVLQSHWDELDQQTMVRYAQATTMTLKYASSDAVPGIEQKQATQILARIACNAHSVTDSELRPIGKGMYPVLALLNHSCAPNCAVSFDGFTVRLNTLTHIDANEELTVGYCHLVAPAFKRRSELQQSYFFKCYCVRCTAADAGTKEDRLLRALRCMQAGCKGALVDDSESSKISCTACGREQDALSQRQLAQSAEAAAGKATSQLERGEVEDAYTSADNAVQLAKQSACKGSAAFTEANDALMRASIEAGNFERALSACKASMAGYEIADYRLCLPMTGLQYATLGKLERHFGKLAEAYRSFRYASSIIENALGRDCDSAKEVRNVQLMQTEAELKQQYEGR